MRRLCGQLDISESPRVATYWFFFLVLFTPETQGGGGLMSK